MHWPNGISDAGATRDQYHHVSDVLPTILECVGVEAPAVYKGVTQQPVEGISLRYTFANADIPTNKSTQYYEMLGHRGIWHNGWKAVTMHKSGHAVRRRCVGAISHRRRLLRVHQPGRRAT